MTGAQFYEKLAEAGEKMVWQVCPYGELRGRFRHSKKKRFFSPITAVYYLQSGCRDFVDVYSAPDVLNKLKINHHFAYHVILAADNRGSKKVRRHLLRTVGVE